MNAVAKSWLPFGSDLESTEGLSLNCCALRSIYCGGESRGMNSHIRTLFNRSFQVNVGQPVAS